MSFYIYQSIEPLILSNSSINLSAYSYKLSNIGHKLSYQLTVIFSNQKLNWKQTTKKH
jgi:hypothetical protein